MSDIHPVDAWVGAKIKQIRTQRGITQMALGKALGIAFQQVQKYERGANRVSASRLYDMARILEVPIEYFFHGYDNNAPDKPPPELEISAQEMDMIKKYRNLNMLHRSAIRTVVDSLSRIPTDEDQDDRIQSSK